MGLYNMRGRWYRWDKKHTTTDFLQLDISHIARELPHDQHATVSWQWTYGDGRKASIMMTVLPRSGFRLVYSYNEHPVEPYTVPVVYSSPTYGGQRPWFLCPHCHKRVRMLYGGRLFLCRDCHGLTYESRQASREDSLVAVIRRRKRAILKRLGSDNDKLPEKPRSMHHKTYVTLAEEFRQLVQLEDDALLLSMVQLVNMAIPDIINPRQDWRQLKEARKHPNILLRRAFSRVVQAQARKCAGESTDIDGNRLTLGELATLAGVPYEFAKEVFAFGLIKPDQGRTTRRRRYRRGLVTWLQKLKRIRDAGIEWSEIVAWTKRRWLPGHEEERRWPIGVEGEAGAE